MLSIYLILLGKCLPSGFVLHCLVRAHNQYDNLLAFKNITRWYLIRPIQQGFNVVAYVGLNKLALYTITWSKMDHSWILEGIVFIQLLIQNNSPAPEVSTLDMAQLPFVAPYFNMCTLNLLYFMPHHL